MTPIDAPPPDASRVDVTVSAPTQLSSLVCATFAPRNHPAMPLDLAEETRAFWDDGYGMLCELVVLADAAGLLGSPDIEPLLERLAEPIVFATPPGLETEHEDEIAVMHERLGRLASDAALRRAYVRQLAALWDVFADAWRTRMRDEAAATAAEWRARLDGGDDVLSLLPESHVARRPAYAPMTREAERSGRVLLSPTLAGQGHIVALPHGLAIASSPAADDPVVRRREAATDVAETLKAMAEPTRLTILTQVAAHPSGVGEIARALHIAQPTASVHLRKLRAAGLVEARKQGSATIYSARPGAVRTALTMAANRLVTAMGGDGVG